jgi:uncharacterized protein
LDLSENVELTIPFLLTVLAAGFIGSAHCAGMCGPLAHFVSKNWLQNLLYNLGRLLGYTALGVILGRIGEVFLESELQWLRYTASVLMIATVLVSCWSVYTNKHLFGFLPASIHKRLFEVSKHVGPNKKAALVGLLTVALPCGWLMTFAAVAASSGSALTGAAVMGTFWASSLPVMTIVPLKAHSWLGPFTKKRPLIAGLLLGTAAMFVIGLRLVVKHHCH